MTKTVSGLDFFVASLDLRDLIWPFVRFSTVCLISRQLSAIWVWFTKSKNDKVFNYLNLCVLKCLFWMFFSMTVNKLFLKKRILPRGKKLHIVTCCDCCMRGINHTLPPSAILVQETKVTCFSCWNCCIRWEDNYFQMI